MSTSIPGSWAALIGDVVRSKQAPDRRRLQAQLEEALRRVNTALDPEQPLTATIGDEFQGLFQSVEEAIEATFRLRILLVDNLDFRAGIGWGELAIVDPARTPLGQDGPCWWRAREALELVARTEQSNQAPTSLRTACCGDRDEERHMNSMLVLRDQVLAGIDGSDAIIIQALLDGHTQLAAAETLGVNQSSVSRRMQAHGLAALLRARQFSV